MNKNRRAPMGMGRGRGNNEKAKDLGGTLKKLLAYLKPYHFKICFVMVFAVCSTIFNMVLRFLQKQQINYQKVLWLK